MNGKDAKLKKIYQEYSGLELCPMEEANKVKEIYMKDKKQIDGYYVEEKDTYITVYKTKVTESTEEIIAQMQVSTAKNIRTIKKCVVYFTILSIISLVLGLIIFIIGIANVDKTNSEYYRYSNVEIVEKNLY